jgi:hypothetical protein
MDNSEQQKNKKESAEQTKPLLRQVATSALGEVAAFSIAIGAVYVTEHLFPKQTQAFVSRLAEHLGRWRGVSPETQHVLAKRILDVGVMNIGGTVNMGVQFTMRRINQKPEEKTPLLYELGRLAAGRIIGTATAFSALALMHSHASSWINKTERGLTNRLGGAARDARLSELLVSNTVQSVGAIAGNVPAQLLYDRLVNPPEKNISK